MKQLGDAFLFWWRLEVRRATGLATLLLFLLLLLLSETIAFLRHPLSPSAGAVLFWLTYLFILFQAIPRTLLELRPEEWNWLFLIYPSFPLLIGMWLYATSLGLAVGLLLKGGAFLLRAYHPSLPLCLMGGQGLSVPLLISAFITARIEGSYALGAVLALPLLLFPLLLLTLNPHPSLLALLLLWAAESILFLVLGPYVQLS
ncbi:MAG: hypothetical protein NZ580_06355 [Bacteroidia bacterium]|nr:hypothetical protein [Bacteroidia bacterium]MDW8235733.1 hypothetical protein [Bacteroidia bacterium]MDW8417611.1 hypothetical protein [Bacteroidia bacterium]